MPRCDRAHLTALLAAALALVVVHALGRFAYTPLLPLLLDDGLFDLSQGAQLATWNYLGYLLGALLALPMANPRGLRLGLPAALLINAGLTLAQVKAANPTMEYDGLYGNAPGWTKDQFVEAVYNNLKPAGPSSRE